MYDTDALIDDFDDALTPESATMDLEEDDDMIRLGAEGEDAEDMDSEDDDDGDGFEVSEEDLLKYDIGETWSDDPIRMYLTQMGEIPLLTRAQEIALAKKIELTRMAFRKQVLESDYCITQAVDILQQVADGRLPFDRTMKISTSEAMARPERPPWLRGGGRKGTLIGSKARRDGSGTALPTSSAVIFNTAWPGSRAVRRAGAHSNEPQRLSCASQQAR